MPVSIQFIWQLWLFSTITLYAQQKEIIHWPIDAKLDSVMKVLNNPVLTKGTTLQHSQKQCEMLFAPTGYVVLIRASQPEKLIPVDQFLSSRTTASRYELESAKVIHFQNVRKVKEGEYSSQATIYFDVKRFQDHVPVTRSVSKVTIPFTKVPPASDYWQIYELRLNETSNRLSAHPHP